MQRIVFACLIAFCFFGMFDAKAQYVFTPEDYAVYAAVLNKWYNSKNAGLILIRDHTTLHTSRDNLEAELNDIFDKAPDLSYEALIDFKAKNIEPYLLTDSINLKTPYEIISQEEINEIFGAGGTWKDFYNKYPYSKGIFTFSRVGFNSRRSQALVCVANQWEKLSGAAAYIFLTKQDDGTWAIQKEVPVWSSWYRQKNEPR
jgi:hypothetical protein